MKSRRVTSAGPRPGKDKPDVSETAVDPAVEPLEGGSPASQEESGPRGVIEQAARDIRRGLVDTDLHGTPTDVPGPRRDPERTEGAVVPPEGADRTTYGRRQRRTRKAGG